jgi:hypothetical protein
MKESDMYRHVKMLFEEKGFSVKSEVSHVDVTAVRGDELVLIEMKNEISLKLIIQAVKRQMMCASVYAAVPKPPYKKRMSKSFKDKEYLLRRLEIGLILVSPQSAEIVSEPQAFSRDKSISSGRRKKKRLLSEFNERSGDYNTGGVARTRIFTAYRERVLKIACLIRENKEMRLRDIVEKSSIKDAPRIVSRNYYGWFERVSRGVYALSDKGVKETDLNLCNNK